MNKRLLDDANARAVLVSVFALLLWWVAIRPLWMQVRGYTMDDAFISFRYAQNLVSTGNLSWNPGEKVATEGYSSILWVLVLAAISWFSGHLVVVVRILDTALVLATAVAVGSSTVRRPGGLVGAGLAVSCFVLNTDLVTATVSGMETSLAIFLETLFFLMVIGRYQETEKGDEDYARQALRISLLGSLAALTRPEFNLAFAVTVATLLALDKRWRKEWKGLLIPYVAIGAAYMAWRIQKYGFLLPLPYYIKVSGERLAGANEIKAFIERIGPLLPWLPFALLARRQRAGIIATGLGTGSLLLFFMHPAPIMDVSHRYVVPLYGALCALGGIGAAALAARTVSRGLVTATLILLATASAIGIQHLDDQSLSSELLTYAAGMNKAHIPLGKALAALGPDHLMAVGDDGAIPYYSKWRAIDTYGLNDRAIALTRSKGGYAPALVLARQPDLMIFLSSTCQGYHPPPAVAYERLLLSAAVQAGYRRAGAVEFAPTYYLLLYVRDDAFGSMIEARLRQAGLLASCSLPNMR